jgi:hypothetical protein
MSVVELDCATADGGLICDHIHKFYPEVGGTPAVFCIFSDAELPVGFTVQETLSDTGDECHREVDGVSNKQLKKMRDRALGSYSICDGGVPRPLDVNDVAAWKDLAG